MDIKRISKWMLFSLLVAGVIFFWICCKDAIQIQAIKTSIESYGIWAPIVFILTYAFATVLMLPGTILTFAGGLIFGPLLGTFYNISGAVLGASMAFLIARYLASDWVAHKVGGRLKQLKEGAEEAGWKFVAIVRLAPIIPFSLLNYALGLTKVRFVSFSIASTIFMLPGCFVYTYLGSLGEEIIYGEQSEWAGRLFLAIGGLVVLLCIPWVIKKLQIRSEGSKS